jgi:Carboxypeptidase regulatory-like domain
MNRLVIIIWGLTATLSAQTTSTMTGILADAKGSPVPGTIISAYVLTGSTNGRFPPVFSALTASDGSFSLPGLTAGTYTLCAENSSAQLLNPCFWSTAPTTVKVAAGGSASGVSLVAQRGVPLQIRINDPQGLLSATPLLDDIRVRVQCVVGPGLPVPVVEKDASGKTLTVQIPPAKPAQVMVYSSNWQLADVNNNPYTTANFTVSVTPTATVSQSGTTTSTSPAAPDLTLNVVGAKAQGKQ